MTELPDDGDAFDSDSELSKSGLILAVQILDDSYKRQVDQIRSLQTRAGVGLGILVATTSGLLVRFFKVLPKLPTTEQQICIFPAIIGACLFVYAVFSFTDAFFNESLPDVYDEDALLNSENGLWLSTVKDLQVNRLDWLNIAIKELSSIADSRVRGLRHGVIAALSGILIFITMELFIRYANPSLVF